MIRPDPFTPTSQATPERPTLASVPPAADAGVAAAKGWQAAIERTVAGMRYDLVDVERSAGGLLRVTIDRVPGQVYATGESEALTVDDCEAVTRQLQYVLEVEGCDYARLEVSSPGLDRPLRRGADYERHVGLPVEITLRLPHEGRKRWRGVLLGRATADDVEGGQVPEGEAWRLEIDDEVGQRKPVKGKQPRKAAPVARPVLDFTLDEVREARLVPVVDFKGRPQPAAPAQPDGAAPQEDDGGRLE